MFCILAFLLFLLFFPILGFFPEYRRWFAKAWSCIVKKATLQPCDVNLAQEVKGKLLGKLIFKAPKLAKFLDKTFSFWALVFVLLNLWSLGYVAVAGLNLWVYDSCDPSNSESCSLSGEACSIGGSKLTLQTAIRDNKLQDYTLQPIQKFGETFTRIPDRIKRWEVADYLGPKPTYYGYQNPEKPIAVEFIDPGCVFCRKLYGNIKRSNFKQNYSLSYVLYSIPNPHTQTGYKFQASYQLARYIEAIKYFPLEKDGLSADWRFIDMLFTGDNGKGNWQDQFNYSLNSNQIEPTIQEMLSELGYTPDQITQISKKSESLEVKESLRLQRGIVEEKVKTIKIPTIIFNGRRYDRVIDEQTLSQG